METQKIINLLNNSENEYSKFAKKKNGMLLIVNQKVIIHTKIQQQHLMQLHK